jgi:hypothetical protein
MNIPDLSSEALGLIIFAAVIGVTLALAFCATVEHFTPIEDQKETRE